MMKPNPTTNQFKKTLAIFTQYLLLAWFFISIVELTFELLNLQRLGGGSSSVAIPTAAIYFGALYYLNKKNSQYLFHMAITFWIGVLLTGLGYLIYVRHMDHWPVGLGFLYTFLGLIGFIQAGILISLHTKSEKS